MAVNQFLVLGVVPANNEQGVPVNTAITISFAKHMDVNTLTEANIKLRKVNGQYIPYTQDYSFEDYRLKVKPSAVLEGNTQYQVEIIGGAEGVRSVTGDYTSTRTYEFSTVLTKEISQPQNLQLSQQGSRIFASWNAPAVVNELESISYNIRVSSSNDVDSPYLWPEFPIGTEYSQAGTSLLVDKDFETGTNYYVYVRAYSVSDVSDWASTQVYLEAPVTGTPSNPDPVDPQVPTTPDPILEQIEAVEIYPSSGAVIQDDTILVAFSDTLDVLPANALYVVQAPYKATLTVLDLLTKYSPTKAIPGTVSLVDGYDSVLQWKASATLPVEKEYVLIVSKDVKGTNMDALGVPIVHAFRSPYERLFGDIKIIKQRIGDFSQRVTDAFIYEFMNINTKFAYETVSNTTSFDQTLFEDGEAPYNIHQYVNLQTAYDVLLNSSMSSGTNGDAGLSKETVVLGQLQVTKEMADGGAAGMAVSDYLEVLKAEIKPWLDTVHGHHNRGYAKPVGAVKGENVEPYPDFFTRSELKTEFDV